jgi:hypothetical protein
MFIGPVDDSYIERSYQHLAMDAVKLDFCGYAGEDLTPCNVISDDRIPPLFPDNVSASSLDKLVDDWIRYSSH